MAAGNGATERFPPQIIKDVPVQLLDGTHQLRYDMLAIFDAESLYSARRNTGREYSFFDILASGTALGIAVLLWAGIRHSDPQLTLDDVSRLFRPKDINRISRSINQAAFDQAEVPEGERDKSLEGDSDKKKASPESPGGSGSGPSQEVN